MTTIAAYYRVSTEDQKEKQTIENQAIACKEWADANGHVIAKEFADDGVSGAVPFADRPAGRELLEHANGYKATIIYSVDRLGRDVVEGVLAYKALNAAGVPAEFVSQSFDDSPQGEFMFNTFLNVAQLERAMIAERTKQGRRRSARKGYYPASRVPYGYLKKDGMLIEDPETADIVRRMYQWADEGAGITAIATRLNEAGIAPSSDRYTSEEKRQAKHGWQGTVVWNMLTNERYVGRATYSGVKVMIPPLVSEELFERVGAAMTKRKQDAPKSTKRVYLLQHLLRCRTCNGRLMSRVWSRGQRRYMCYQRVKYGADGGGHEGVVWHIFADDAEARIRKLIENFWADPEKAASKLEVYADQIDAANEKATAELPDLEKRLTELAGQEDTVVDLAAARKITDEQLARKMEKLSKNRAGINARIAELKATSIGDFNKNELREAWARDLAKQLRNGAKLTQGYSTDWREFQKPEAKRFAQGVKAYIRSFIDQIWLEPDGSLTVEGPVQVSSSSG